MDYIRYANQGATRNLPLSQDLVSALSFLPELGVQAEVFSGGQPVAGQGPRVGSTRHDLGGAADVFFYKDGRKLDWANPNDLPIFQEIVSRGRKAGLTGFGAGPGYMQPGSMHIGFGNSAIWGAGGKGKNAPDWLRQAYYGADAPTGGNMAPQTGLLGTPVVSTRGQMQQQEPERLPFFQRPNVGNFFDTLAMGLEGMTLNPNLGLMQAAQGRMQQRRETAQTAQQRNRTADWLESQGMNDLAQGVRSGAINAREALALARGGGQEATAAQRNYEFLISQGVPPEKAMERAFGGGQTINLGGQGPQIGTIPQGYQVAQDPETGAYRMEPIPGGPADIERQESLNREQKIKQQRGTKESVVSRDVDRLISMIDKGGIFDLPEAGIVGGALSTLGINQEAVTFRNTLSGIQSQVAFDRLQQMREASKTGGALGAVSERELDLLMSALGALQQTTDPKTLKENLMFIRDTMTKIENDPVASQAYYGGTQSQSQAAPNGGGFSVTGVVD